MAQCLVVDSAASGVLVASDANPCTTLVALTPAEYAQISTNLMNLSAEDGFVLAAGIVGVWAAAFAVRAAIRVLNAADTGGYEG